MKAQRITYQGREYRRVTGHCTECDLRKECDALHSDIPVNCGGVGTILRETLRSRIAHWLYDPTPETDEGHAATRYSTLDEVNARRGYQEDE